MSQFTPNQKVKVRLTVLGHKAYQHYCEHSLTPPLPLYRRNQWVIYTYGQLIEVFGEQPRPDGQEIFMNNEILLDE
ncbi:MAG TPA: hypothetical protein PL066_03390 [bacterium]|nr:hypothetical protein [bacterium]